MKYKKINWNYNDNIIVKYVTKIDRFHKIILKPIIFKPEFEYTYYLFTEYLFTEKEIKKCYDIVLPNGIYYVVLEKNFLNNFKPYTYLIMETE